MKAWKMILLVLLSYLFTLLIALPARVAVGGLPMPASLQLQGISGTLWEGQVQTIRWKTLQIGPVHWAWQGSALLTGEIAAQVELADPQGLDGRGTLGWNGEWNIRHARLHLPARVLPEPLGLTAELSGDIDARLAQLRFTPEGCIAAQGDLYWKAGRVVSIAGALTTGDTRLRLGCRNRQWRTDFTQRSEQVSSTGQFTLSGSREYRGKSEVAPGADFPPALMLLLTQSARQQANGTFTLDTSGRW
ncbi:MAG: type II secretion system protein N [Silvania sp.]|uniref:type II secretion system protein N n=1 Tax=Silvania sp. TaxID=3016633 RepID=UPI003EE6322F